MVKIAVENGTSIHTGSTVVGPVAGTLTVGSNTFVKIEGKKMMVNDGTMVIPSHQYNLLPPLFHSHAYIPTATKTYVTIEGRPVIVVGDAYVADSTQVNAASSNSFVEAL